MAYCWISSPGLPRGTPRLFYKVDLTLFPLKSAPLLASLRRLMPLALTQVKVLGPAPPSPPRSPRPTVGHPKSTPFSSQSHSRPSNTKHSPHLCLLMPPMAPHCCRKNFKLFDRIKVQPQLVPIKFIHSPVIPKPLRLSGASVPFHTALPFCPSHFIFQDAP